MKRTVLTLLTVGIILCAAVLTVDNTNAKLPYDIVFNYMEHKGTAKMVLATDDYVLINRNLRELEVYDKRSGEPFDCGDTVFDTKKTNLFLVATFDNKVVFTASDDETNGSAFYLLDLNTMEKSRLKSYNSVRNKAAFLGIDDILGIVTNANDVFTVMSNRGNYMVHRGKIAGSEDVLSVLQNAFNSVSFSVPKTDLRIAATEEFIFVIDSFNRLLRYDYGGNAFVDFGEEIINDFFITGNSIYYNTIKHPDELKKTDFDFSESKTVGKVAVKYARPRGETVVILDEEGNLRLLENDTLKKTSTKIEDENMWDTDGEKVWYVLGESSILNNMLLN